MKTANRLLRHILPYGGSILFAILCTILITVCEMLYISILAETIDVIKIIDTKGLPTEVTFLSIQGKNLSPESKITYNGWKIYLEDSNDAIRFVSFIAVLILASIVVKGVLSYGYTYLTSRVGQKLVLNLQTDFYSRLVNFPLEFFAKRRTGDIISRGINDMNILQYSANSISDVIRAMTTVLVFVSMMFIKSWQLTVLTALVFPPTIYVINRFGRRIKKASTRIQAKLADISSYLERVIYGIRIIKSFAAEDWEKMQFAKINREKYAADMKRIKLTAYQMPLIDIISAFGMVTVFWFGFWQVITDRLTTGWFLGFITMVVLVYKPVRTVGTFNSTFQQALASAERIFEILDIQSEVRDAPDAIPTWIKGDVEINDVSFAYDNQKPVLNHINLKVKAGEVIALVGPSGAGKTTLVSLLPKFYNVTSGDITIDGYSISKIMLKSLRSQIGLVPQETILFSGTARENIAYGRHDASDEEIIQAAKNANAHEFIMQLSNGYDTIIGEYGMQLSGGQRQRLAIARAILKNPRILILDEATSSLDTESEMLVQEALTNLMNGRTTFIIAHRLSTVMNADRIIVIDNGEIVESGTHNQLYAQHGLYRKLCDSQLIKSPLPPFSLMGNCKPFIHKGLLNRG